jgi:NTP pyrophosphatase (non-canonical NTP hydrolase)
MQGSPGVKQELEAERSPAHVLYSRHLEGGDPAGAARALWGRIPATMSEAYELLSEVRKGYGEVSDALEELRRVMKNELRRLGILTSKAEENIERMDGGVVEGGHQPVILGGPSLILNKVAYASSLCGLGDDGYVPLLYVADYDGLQPELANVRVPSPSPRGLLVSHPSSQELEGTPIWNTPNPPEAWLRDTIDRIRGNYRGLLRREEPRAQERALQNLSHAVTIIKEAYHSTDNVSDWSTKILGGLVNLESDMGVPILQFSAPGARRLFQPGYELLLSEPNRSGFIEATNKATELIESAGYRSGIGRRPSDYVPFFLECLGKRCTRTRVELKYRRALASSSASVTGKCPKCGEIHEFSFNASNPDLSEIADMISPRVDSRQVVVDSVIPVLAHVGGPGETSYYAEVIPAAGALGVPFPFFLRYTRTFYNAPWNERHAKGLEKGGLPTLMSGDLFGALSQWVEARNSGDGAGLTAAHSRIRSSIEGTYERLLARLGVIESEIEAIKGKLRDEEDRSALISLMREKQNAAHGIEAYLSSAFGRFSPERFGQEVSWAWLDLAVASGVGDLMGAYLREYNGHTPNSSMFFVNF